MTRVAIVWFKRDLRVQDHAALAHAALTGAPVLPLYIVEPDYWRLPEHSGRQWGFVRESLDALNAALGGRLVVRVGEAVAVFDALHKALGVASLHAHEETGLLWTYARDRAVRRWAKTFGVAFYEARQSGVIRGLKTRDGWARRWDRFMAQPAVATPKIASWASAPSDPWPEAERLCGDPDPCTERQPGGRPAGVALLSSFLVGRARRYRRAMSSPVHAFEACSRLSPHLAFGTVSMRETAQAAWAGLAAAKAAEDRPLAQSLDSFIARLHWRDHFTQKLEDAPDLEARCLHSAYEGLRPVAEPDDPDIAAWIEGRTGFPFLDACMRALKATGWLNFRMRAMVMAFASYHLWRDWRVPAQKLAARFVDFEPGIHYAQAQMQSGTTGVNTARIYNPVKQSHDQDPDGEFIRRWAPELAKLPADVIHAPWAAPDILLASFGVRLGDTYPERCLDHEAAARFARAQIYAVQSGADYGREADAVQAKHGSRRSGLRPRGAGQRGKKSPKPRGDGQQGVLDL
ncbi:MAG: FAD-binding domain-containing protein [Maricaulaceae bacterium]